MPRVASVLLALVAALLAPAAALAGQVRVVEPSGAGGAYRTIGAAVAASQPGDTVAVAKGDYAEAVTIPGALTGLTITGVDGARVLGAALTRDVLRIEASGVRVNTLAIGAPGSARSAVRVDPGATAVLTGVAVVRTEPSESQDPLVDVAGTATVAQAYVLQQTGGPGRAAIGSSGQGSLVVEDSAVLSATGPAVAVSGTGESAVLRSTLVSRTSDAVRLVAPAAGSRRLAVDSSEVVGGPGAAGIRVATQGAPASDVTTLLVRHATILGATRGIRLDATAPTALGVPAGTAGSIAAGVTSSIIREPSWAKGDPGGIASPRNAVALAFRDTDTPEVPEADRNAQATVTATNRTFTADAGALFGHGLHLRAGAPAIDKGPAHPEEGESRTDIDGQPRRIGAATDLGADEFLNVAPRVTLEASSRAPAEGQPVTFTSSATDANVGDAVTTYHWDFGDGGRAATTVPTVSHAFERPGTFSVRLAAVDRGGLPSEVAALPVTVHDARAPVVGVTSPRDGARLRAGRRLVLRGTDRDATGIRRVEVSLRRTVSSRSCRHYTGRRFARGSCTAFRWVPARLRGSRWTLAIRRGLRVPPGRYEVRARGVDLAGLVSPGARAAFRVG